MLSNVGSEKLTGRWLGVGRPKEDAGVCAGEALNGIAVAPFSLSLGDLVKADREWGPTLAAVRGLWRCLRHDHCLLRVWDKKPGILATILQWGLETYLTG